MIGMLSKEQENAGQEYYRTCKIKYLARCVFMRWVRDSNTSAAVEGVSNLSMSGVPGSEKFWSFI